MMQWSEAEQEAFREQYYNATVIDLRRCHEDLMVMRVALDSVDAQERMAERIPGQHTVLGLGNWEPRCAGTQQELPNGDQHAALVKRAYSISSPLITESGVLTTAKSSSWLEFYVALVRQAKNPPALTPRLFQLSKGSRLHCGHQARGRYTLGSLDPSNDILFASTGTGEAPHNAMLVELANAGHQGRVVNISCVRYRGDLAYLKAHQRLEKYWSNYCYVPLTTREPENLDPSRPDFLGKQYIQQYVGSSDLERDTQFCLAPANCHIFLCGNPQMIGIPPGGQALPRDGMAWLLEQRGFRLDLPRSPGNIHFERYWN